RRDAPDQHRAPAPHVEHRVAERAQQEAGIREADHEPVVPAKRLQELTFLDDCLSHDSSSSSAIRAQPRQYGPLRAKLTPADTSFNAAYNRLAWPSHRSRSSASAARRETSRTAIAGGARRAGARGTRSRSRPRSTRACSGG